ncbi:MAG: hypothetical protein ACLFPS_05890 [Clostridia bacterium]
MPTKKDGTKITWKEFFKLWKEGIQNLTPLQRLSNESRGTLITLIGFVVALIAMIIYRDKFIVSWFAYGLILVFIGNIYTTALKWLGIRQQLKFFKSTEAQSLDINKIMDSLDNEEINQEEEQIYV